MLMALSWFAAVHGPRFLLEIDVAPVFVEKSPPSASPVVGEAERPDRYQGEARAAAKNFDLRVARRVQPVSKEDGWCDTPIRVVEA